MTLRHKFLLTVTLGAIVPLALVGLWLTRSVAVAGESLLRSQMTTALTHVVETVEARWVHRQSDLLLLADNQAVRDGFQRAGPIDGTGDDITYAYLRSAYADMQPFLDQARFLDSTGTQRWVLSSDLDETPRLHTADPPATSLAAPAAPGLPVHLEVREDDTGHLLGTMEARVRLRGLLPAAAAETDATGSSLAVLDARSGETLLAPSFDPILLADEHFELDGQRWITVRRALSDPPLDIVLAAPLDAYIQPFQERARQGAVALLVIALALLLVHGELTRRLTASLERLVGAAEAVAAGDLDRKLEASDRDEVARVAAAFNRMTENLRRMIGELGQRRALAAVGEFASELAHEIRNPLTSMRLDLQLAAERMGGDERARRPLDRALREVVRLEQTVSGALRVARSGSIELRRTNLLDPLAAAAHAARPEFDRRGAVLEGPVPGSEPPLPVEADEVALEQLFLNLLMNAAHALDEGGRAVVTAERNGTSARVSIEDTGRGIPAERLERVFEPFFSTKREGTGLGLAIAERIAAAHGGGIEVESEVGHGTTVRVRLPATAATE